MPYDAGVIMGKFMKICCAVCKSSSNTVVKTCVVAGHMKNFEEQLIVSLLQRWRKDIKKTKADQNYLVVGQPHSNTRSWDEVIEAKIRLLQCIRSEVVDTLSRENHTLELKDPLLV